MSNNPRHSPTGGHPVAPDGPAAPRRQLTLYDTTSIIVGIIIGSGLYETTPLVAQNVPSTAWLLAFWAAGGAFALIGALCFAELATAYPADGGDYVYLKRGFGPAMGFLFAWAQLWVIRPGSIGAMAYIFARYAAKLLSPNGALTSGQFAVLAACPVVVLTLVNVLGVRQGKWTQNVLTGAKVLGLLSVFAIGLLFTAPASDVAATGLATEAVATTTEHRSSMFLAMIFIVFTYGGWNDMAFVAAEVRDPSRNILRALALGTAAVMGIYLLANIAFVHALGFQGVGKSEAVAADVAALALGDVGGKLISLLICISTLGAINGMIFTGARIYYAMGQDHPFFALVGRWSPRFGTPAWSLVIQAATTLAVVLGFRSFGQNSQGKDAFEQLVIFTQPVFWSFLLASGVSLFALRRREPNHPRPYRVPLYPLPPLVFCAGCAVIVYASLAHSIENSSWEALWSIGLMVVGAALAWLNPGGTMRQDVS